MKHFTRFFLAAALLLAGCGGGDEPTRPNNFVPLTAISIQSQYPRIAAGTSNQFRATGDFSGAFTDNLTEEVTWTSSNPGVITVSDTPGSKGQAKSVVAGEATITASHAGGVVGTVTFTVTTAIATQVNVTPPAPTVAKGLTQQFTATGAFNDPDVPTQDITRDVVWSVGPVTEPAVATIDAAGLATAVNVGGPVTVSADFGGVTGTAQLTVTAPVVQSLSIAPPDPDLVPGETRQFTATASLSDGNTETVAATWTSSSTNIATISATGLATAGTAAGTTTITATHAGQSATTTLEVIIPLTLAITPSSLTVGVGETSAPLTATGTFAGGGSRDLSGLVTWESDNENIATVNATTGAVTGVAIGTTTISAEIGGRRATAAVTVQ